MKDHVGPFGSVLGRRLLLLFVACAFLPIAGFAWLSLGKVTTTLEQQFQDELRQHAKTYGLAVLERLQQVDAFTLEDFGGAHAGASRAHLRGVGDEANDSGWIPDDRGERGSSENRPAHTAAIHFSAEEEGGLTSGRPVLHITSDQPARILLVRQSNGGRGPRWAATVDPAYLWANPEGYPLMTDFCVVSDSLQVVRCSRDMPGELLSKLVTPAKQGGSGSVRWSTADDTYRAAVWPLFLRSHFIGESWNVIAIQPEGYALKAEREFRSGFMPVAVVTLLLVLLASTVQIRRVLHPLRQLLAGTRRIAAHDFTAQIPTRDRDELDELASSFNTMASQLGFYFRTQTALTEIDHTILTSLDMRRIAEIALGCIEEIIVVDASAIGLPRSTAGQICVHARRRGEPVAATPFNMSFDLGAVQPRGSHLALQWLEPEDGDPMRGCFDELRSTPRLHSVLPIARAERVLGVLVLGNGAPVALDADHLAQLASVVDRLAIAISSEQRERQLLDRARYDSLTRLPNRYYLTELTEAALARARGADRLLAVLFVDLDSFKLTNDTLGHSAGDMLLQCAAERIKQAVRDGDIVARPGGDEFIIVLSDLPDEQSAADVAAKVIARLSEPFDIGGQAMFLGASAGIAIGPQGAAEAGDLFKCADTAMYVAKRRGRGRFVYFEESMNAAAVERTALDRELRTALVQREFVLYFQPQLDLQTGRLVGAEALIRWQHPQRGLLGPGSFLTAAEDIGLIEPIGEWVIDEACAQLRHWLDAGFREPIVSFNVSAVQLRRADFADRLEASLARHGVESTSLEMEVTESIFVDESATAVSSLRRLRSTGMRVAIDDFGTGYSSFSYLASLPVSTLKLDRTFVKDITTSASAATIATAIVNMAHALGKDVVAEGVEMEMQIGLLARIGCERAQGYAIARPMPAPAFVEFWQTFRPSSFASLPHAAGRGRRRGVTQFVQLPTARPS